LKSYPYTIIWHHYMEEIIYSFFKAFQKKDFNLMNSLYTENIEFKDPVFGKLNAKETRAMWRMLCETGKDLIITFDKASVSDNKAVITWHAGYTFPGTKKWIQNVITSEFEFDGTQIAKQKDRFSLQKWFIMAFGNSALFWSWLPYFRKKFQNEARKGLAYYMKRKRLS